MPERISKKFIIYLLIAALVIATGLAVYYYAQLKQARKLAQNPTAASAEEVKAVLAKLGKIIELPTGEVPTLATITDVDKLKSQAFFAKAKNGDQVIMYNQLRQAILYRPSENKIISAAPMTPPDNNAPNTPAAAPLKVALYNGTNQTGLTQKVEQDLKAKFADIQVVAKTNATRRDYVTTLVIDLAGNQAVAAQALAQELKGQVAPLPAGEIKPATTTTDLLIIVGKSYVGQ